MSNPLPPRPRKAAAMIDAIEGNILSGAWQAGYRLPTVRRLQDTFHLSYSTVQRALAYLRHRGLLDKRSNEIVVGNEASGKTPHFAQQIAVFISPFCNRADFPGIYYNVLGGIQNAALEYDFSLQVTPLHINHPDFVEHLCSTAERAAGVILLQECDLLSTRYPLNKPTVGVMIYDDFQGRISLFDLDPVNLAHQAADYFDSHDRREVLVVSDRRATYRQRAELFRSFWRQRHGELPDYIEFPFDRTLDELLRPGLGLFVTSDNVLQNLCEQYAETHPGRQLSRDFRTLGADGKRLLLDGYEAFPTVALNWRSVGFMAFEECLALIRSPGRQRRRIWLPGQLVE